MSAEVQQARPIREALQAFAWVTLGTVALSALGAFPPLGDYVHLGVAALFLLTALHLTGREDGQHSGQVAGGPARYGLSLGGVLDPPEHAPAGLFGSVRDLLGAIRRATPLAAREAAFALAVVALVFPPFIAGFYVFHVPERSFQLSLPPELPSYLLTQVLVIALPEEAFFRGYLQTRLSDGWPRRVRLLGAQVSLPALLVTSIAFALIHFAVDHHPARLAVFFPAMLFGWLRERRGGIGAAVFVHALCNLLSDVLARGWL